MKKNRFWIPLVMVAALALQGFAMPSMRRAAYPGRQIIDENGDTIRFETWNLDSLKSYVDSVLKEVPLDSENVTYSFLESNDTIQNYADSFERAVFVRDSIIKAQIAFQKWFDSLPKKEQKKWTIEHVIIPAKIHRADSILARKDSIKAVRDSIVQNTPRVLETPFIHDSLRFRRLLKMTRDTRFGDITVEKFDTSYNAHFYDYPFFNQDINATWLGVAGSPTQGYNVYKRTEEENAIFFTPYRSWTYDPSTLPMYNTKTPYTELGYSGTLLAGNSKEEINAHVLTTQNILPSLNLTIEANKFGSAGQLMKEQTNNTHLAISMSYLGKKYAAHGGWIRSSITRTENGGIREDGWIRDTTVSSKEIEVNLTDAKSDIKRNTLFLNHHYRIPFGSDSLTTAFVGHSFEWDRYKRSYSDKITDKFGKEYYNNAFFIDPNKSTDTLDVNKVDNKIYLRLQPWKDESALSKIDVGVGDKVLGYRDAYLTTDEKGTSISHGTTWENNIYTYAGLRGQAGKYFFWNAGGQLTFAGVQAGDFSVDADVKFNAYPFRRHRNSPLSVSASFHTDLTTPDHYERRLLINHFQWDNASFTKKSTTKVGGRLDIPAWKLDAEVGYTMLTGAVYFDTLAVARQSATPVNVISGSLNKEFDFKWVHLDNKILVQYSSNQAVVPVPLLSLNLRWWFQFDVVKKVMQMQIGANVLYNTLWNMPGYNPNLGVFYNQNKFSYGNCPYVDVFLNVQWKRACIFIKGENINQGWPLKNRDYFTAAHQIHTQRAFKVGIFWPFYILPAKKHVHAAHDHGHGHEVHNH